MKKNVNKILTFALALVVVAAMAGCGSTSDPSTSSSVPVPPSSDTASSLPETSSSQSGSVDTGSEYDVTAQKYLNAITGARAAENTMDVFTHDANLNMSSFRNNYAEMKNEDGTAYTEDQILEGHNSQQQMQLDLLGLKAEDLVSYASSVSAMNTQASGIAIVKPVAGKEETVKAALETYVQNRAKAFEGYLQDQYEMAKGGYVKTLEDGTMIMVIDANQDATYEGISKALMAE